MKAIVKSCTILALVLIFSINNSFSQSRVRPEDGRKTQGRQSDIFVNVSTNGLGLGYKKHYPFRNQDTKFNLGIELSGLRSTDSVPFYDYNTGRYVQEQADWFIFAIPITAGFKRRLWREQIEDSMRPFITFEAGPVLGVAFPTIDSFKENISNPITQITIRGFFGIGVEFGESERGRAYGITFGGHYMEFLDELGAKRAYSGIDIRINFINNF